MSAIVNETLLQIPKHQVAEMREEVIRLIPRVIYADPRASRLETVEDAFEIAVKGVLGKVQKTRKDMKEGKDPGNAFWEINPTEFDMPKLGMRGRKFKQKYNRLFLNKQQSCYNAGISKS